MPEDQSKSPRLLRCALVLGLVLSITTSGCVIDSTPTTAAPTSAKPPALELLNKSYRLSFDDPPIVEPFDVAEGWGNLITEIWWGPPSESGGTGAALNFQVTTYHPSVDGHSGSTSTGITGPLLPFYKEELAQRGDGIAIPGTWRFETSGQATIDLRLVAWVENATNP
jgi:hypothetical protein